MLFEQDLAAVQEQGENSDKEKEEEENEQEEEDKKRDVGRKVSFYEFVHCLAIFCKDIPTANKVRFAFRIYDMEDDGYISRENLFDVMKAVLQIRNNNNTQSQSQSQSQKMTKSKKSAFTDADTQMIVNKIIVNTYICRNFLFFYRNI